MTLIPPCPNCQSAYVYEDGQQYICPECAHEWMIANATSSSQARQVFRDANGTELHDGDSVTLIKDLKLKGTSEVIKIGTKVKNILLVEGDHNIDCKIAGFGPMKLKSEFVKKL